MKNDSIKGLMPFINYLVLVLLFCYQIFLQVSPSVFFQDLMLALSVTHGEIGLIISSYYFTYSSLQIPMGILVDAYGLKKIALVTVPLMIFSNILFSLSSNLYMLIFARLLMGASCCSAFIMASRYIMGHFRDPLVTYFLSWIELAGFLCAALVGWVVSFMMKQYDWHQVYFSFSFIGLPVLIYLFIFLPDEESESSEVKVSFSQKLSCVLGELLILVRDKYIWFFSIWGMLISIPVFGIGGLWGPTYISNVFHFSSEISNHINSFLFIGICFGLLVAGKVASHKHVIKYFLIVSSLLSFFVILFLSLFNQPVTPFGLKVMFFVLGLSSSAFIIPFVYVKDKNDSIKGTAIAFVNLFAQVGGFAMQALFGFGLTIKHNFLFFIDDNYLFPYRTSMFFLSCFILLAVILSIILSCHLNRT